VGNAHEESAEEGAHESVLNSSRFKSDLHKTDNYIATLQFCSTITGKVVKSWGEPISPRRVTRMPAKA
jgi:hypothetical protein